MHITLLLNEIFKKGVFIAVESDVLSIYIRAWERDAHVNPPLFPVSLIFHSLPLHSSFINCKLSEQFVPCVPVREE